MKRSRLRRRYGHTTGHLPLWQVSVYLTSPQRPRLRHQLEYTVRASTKLEAEEKAGRAAERDGHTVVGFVGAQRRPG